MMSRHYQKITAPIHRSTAYDFNVQLDHVSLNKDNNTIMPYTPDTEKLGVKEHEILVRYKDPQHRYKDNRLRVFSALNNVIYNNEMLLDMYNDDPAAWEPANIAVANYARNETAKQLRVKNKLSMLIEKHDPENAEKCAQSLNRVLHRHIQYVGVAITPQNLYPKHSRQDSQGFACSRGGLNTIINTGSKRILPGQKIKIDFALPDHAGNQRFVSPSHFSNGVPHSKMLVQTHPVDEFRTSDVFLHRILESMYHLKCPKNDGSNAARCYVPLQLLRAPNRGDANKYMPPVFFLWKDNDETLDIDTVDASMAMNEYDRQALDQPANGVTKTKLVRFHAETTDEFKAKVEQFINSISNIIPFHSIIHFVTCIIKKVIVNNISTVSFVRVCNCTCNTNDRRG